MLSEADAKTALADLDVSRETLSLLERYVSLLDAWRRRSNLIGPNEMGHIWSRHVYDCAQLIPLIGEGAKVVDLGSGAGLPGLILGCHAATTGGSVQLVESVGKKCAFLQAVSSELDLPTRIYNQRIEDVPKETSDFVTARALAPLPKLLDYTSTWIDRGATGLFFKGRRWREELTDASECWTLAYEAIPSRTHEGGVILKIMEAQRV